MLALPAEVKLPFRVFTVPAVPENVIVPYAGAAPPQFAVSLQLKGLLPPPVQVLPARASAGASRIAAASELSERDRQSIPTGGSAWWGVQFRQSEVRA